MPRIESSFTASPEVDLIERRGVTPERRGPQISGAGALPPPSAIQPKDAPPSTDTLERRGSADDTKRSKHRHHCGRKGGDDESGGVFAKLRAMLGLDGKSGDGDKIYTGLSNGEMDTLAAELHDLGRCGDKHVGKAVQDLAKGDLKHAKKELKKALKKQLKGKHLSRSDKDALVDKLLLKLANFAKLSKSSNEDIKNQLRASKPGAAPIPDNMTKDEMMQLLARLDTGTNPIAQKYLTKAKALLDSGDLAGAKAALEQAAAELNDGVNRTTRRQIQRAKRDANRGNLRGSVDDLAQAGAGVVARDDLGNGAKDRDDAVGDLRG